MLSKSRGTTTSPNASTKFNAACAPFAFSLVPWKRKATRRVLFRRPPAKLLINPSHAPSTKLPPSPKQRLRGLPAGPLKRAPCGKFSPEREKFLRRHLEAFYTAGDNGIVRNFWPGLFTAYWDDFPWRLPVDVDPHPGMLVDTEPLSPRDVDARTVVHITTQGALIFR
ncbi:hypothetical protein C8F04DRAFT_1265546 [Mycena alexandri]|uniref:Uncharacterized protein n=1 Tax=Mycena alexandri TaxID=1745969 RepID=A0AAD6WVF3_9AGAR|nr:hypothetical protein C8F04DRAFT_1265546 [Mycena alexandri]